MSNDAIMLAFVAGIALGIYGIKSAWATRVLRSLFSMSIGGGLIYWSLTNQLLSLLFES